FGSLCYPTNDYDDVGKLKAKADIGIFVGYAPTKKAYRIYNKRTRKIQETVHVTFDKLTEGLTPTHNSVGLAPNSQTSVQNIAELEISALQSGHTRFELEDAPAITDESQTPPPDPSVVNEENLDDVDDGNIFEPYVADEDASSSNTADVNVTHNSPPPHVQT
nr:integrase, catalytic region, zinc finger, CCHC-type, peptidase aspartic, catalytic [Tanacetum cinerariifolium]